MLNDSEYAKVLYKAAFGADAKYLPEIHEDDFIGAVANLSGYTQELLDLRYRQGLTKAEINTKLLEAGRLRTRGVYMTLDRALSDLRKRGLSPYGRIGLPTRIANMLCDMGIITTGDILGLTCKSLIRKQKFGYRTMRSLIDTMNKAGYTKWASERLVELDELYRPAVCRAELVFKEDNLSESALREYAVSVYSDLNPDTSSSAVYIQGVLDLLKDAVTDKIISEKAHRCIYMYYGFGLTQAHIGDEFGVTRARIHSIIKQALDSLRRYAKIDHKVVEGISFADISHSIDFNQVESALSEAERHTITYKKIADNLSMTNKVLQTKVEALTTVCARNGIAISDFGDLSSLAEAPPTAHQSNLEIGNLRLSTRSYNYLYRAGVRTTKDILAYDLDKLFSIRHLGVGCIREIAYVMRNLGFTQWAAKIERGVLK